MAGRDAGFLGCQLPPPAGVQPPLRWGVESHLHTLFGDSAAAITVTPCLFNFRYRSVDLFIEVFRTCYGPVHKAFAALPAEQAKLLARELGELLHGLNQAGEGALRMPGAYLEFVIIRR